MHAWRWLDQDVLNRFVNGHYLRINMKWNYLVDWQFLRRDHIVAQAPKDVREEYEEALVRISVLLILQDQTTGPGSIQTQTLRAFPVLCSSLLILRNCSQLEEPRRNGKRSFLTACKVVFFSAA